MQDDLKRWIKLVETTSRLLLYHGTISTHLPAIFNKGLHPDLDRIANWQFDDNPKGVVWLADSEQQARYYASQVASRYYHGGLSTSIPFTIVLRTPRTFPVTADPNDRHEFYTSASIPPKQIEIKLHDQWQPLAALDARIVASIGCGNWDDPVLDDEHDS